MLRHGVELAVSYKPTSVRLDRLQRMPKIEIKLGRESADS